MRHIKVGGKITGVSMVQLTAWDVQDTESGIAHVKIDENGYFVSSEKTRVTGGEFVAEPESNSNLLGPMERGEIKGGV